MMLGILAVIGVGTLAYLGYMAFGWWEFWRYLEDPKTWRGLG